MTNLPLTPQDVAVAVEVGMAAALLLFVNDVTSSIHVHAVPSGRTLNGGVSGGAPRLRKPPPRQAYASTMASMEEALLIDEDGRSWSAPLVVPPHAAYVEVTGSLLFGAGELLERALEDMHRQEPVAVSPSPPTPTHLCPHLHRARPSSAATSPP